MAEVSNSMYGRSGGHVAVVCALFMCTPVTLVAPSTSFICAQCCLHVAITSDHFCSSSELRKRKFYRRCFVFQVFSDVPVSPLDLLLALTLYLALLGKKTFDLTLFLYFTRRDCTW